MADPASRESALFPHVESGEGAEFRLSLVRADGSRVSVALGVSECVALAAAELGRPGIAHGLSSRPRSSRHEPRGIGGSGMPKPAAVQGPQDVWGFLKLAPPVFQPVSPRDCCRVPNHAS